MHFRPDITIMGDWALKTVICYLSENISHSKQLLPFSKTANVDRPRVKEITSQRISQVFHSTVSTGLNQTELQRTELNRNETEKEKSFYRHSKCTLQESQQHRPRALPLERQLLSMIMHASSTFTNHMLGFAPSLRFLWQQNSVPTLQKTIGRDCKPSTLTCMRRQKDHIHTLKIMYSMSDFSGLWYYYNNKACTERPNEHNYTVSNSTCKLLHGCTAHAESDAETTAVSQGTSNVTTNYCCKYTTSVHIQMHYVLLQSLIQSHATTVYMVCTDSDTEMTASYRCKYTTLVDIQTHYVVLQSLFHSHMQLQCTWCVQTVTLR